MKSKTKLFGLMLTCLLVSVLAPMVYATTPKTDNVSWYPSDFQGVHWFVNATDISPGTAGSYVTVDVSSYVPSNATGAVLEICDGSGGNARLADVRAVGDTHDFYSASYTYDYCHKSAIVKLNATKCFEAKVQLTDVDIYLLGYTDLTVTLFTIPIDKSTSTANTWVSTNVSTNVSPNATGVIVRMVQTSSSIQGNSSVRCAGSTDNRVRTMNRGSWYSAYVGLNSSYCFEQKVNSTNIKCYLYGYFNNLTTAWHVDAIDVSTATTGAWVDTNSTEPIGAHGVFLESESLGGELTPKAAVRDPASEDDRYDQSAIYSYGTSWTLFDGHAWFGTGINSTGFFQQKIGYSDRNYYISGYTKYNYQNKTFTLSGTPDTIISVTWNGVPWSYTLVGNQLTFTNLTEDGVGQIDYMMLTTIDIVTHTLIWLMIALILGLFAYGFVEPRLAPELRKPFTMAMLSIVAIILIVTFLSIFFTGII